MTVDETRIDISKHQQSIKLGMDTYSQTSQESGGHK